MCCLLRQFVTFSDSKTWVIGKCAVPLNHSPLTSPPRCPISGTLLREHEPKLRRAHPWRNDRCVCVCICHVCTRVRAFVRVVVGADVGVYVGVKRICRLVR
jgi:hypothetical protein